jgi:hypothetical protein
MTHDSVLYLDMDLPVYKTASNVPKTSDLSWLSSQLSSQLPSQLFSPHGYHPDTLYHLNPPIPLSLVAILVDSSNPP